MKNRGEGGGGEETKKSRAGTIRAPNIKRFTGTGPAIFAL